MASVYEHAPYVEWDIAESSIRALSTDLTLVTVDVTVQIPVDAYNFVTGATLDASDIA